VAAREVKAESAIAPNLVPMVDIMFLMLLFFMLGSDMQRRELEEVRLPVASTVKVEREDAPDADSSPRMVINVFHDSDSPCKDYEVQHLCTNEDHWAIGIAGHDARKGHEKELLPDLETRVADDRERRNDPDPTKPSELRCLIRADEAALYQFVQKAMVLCGDAKIWKVEVAAAAPLAE
jgi:biopolymer transport protein ExbD